MERTNRNCGGCPKTATAASAEPSNPKPSRIVKLGEIDLNPSLTAEESARGTALRMAGMWRSNEGRFEDAPESFIAVVIALIKIKNANAEAGTGKAAGARLFDYTGLVPLSGPVHPAETAKIRISADGASYQYASEEPDGPTTAEGTWLCHEFHLVVSSKVKAFCVRALGLATRTSVQDRRDLIAFYGKSIANASIDADYPQWLAGQRARLLERPAPEHGPLMSIVTPAYKTPPEFLRCMLQSVIGQTYANWELVLVNASPDDGEMASILEEFEDKRIHVVIKEQNEGIVGNTNAGIAHCSGEYVLFLDHDDVIEPYALAEMVKALEEADQPAMLYCDEDNIDEEDKPSLPIIKPPFNEDLLESNNYLIHWLCVRRDVLLAGGLSAQEMNGAQDYDITFKAAESGYAVARVPHVLYHWRIHSGSTAGDPTSKSYTQDAGCRAIERHLTRMGRAASAKRGWAYFTYETRYEVPSPAPRIAVVGFGEISPTTLATVESYASSYSTASFAVCIGNKANPSDVAAGLAAVAADLVLLTADGIALQPKDFDALVGLFSRPDVVAASPRILRDDGLIDYAGSLILPEGNIGHLLEHLPSADGGYIGRAQRPYDAAALNWECCLVRADWLRSWLPSSPYEEMEHALAEGCLRAYAEGKHNVFFPYASASRVKPYSLLHRNRSAANRADGRLLVQRNAELLAGGDPSHSPNFDPRSLYYRLNWNL